MYLEMPLERGGWMESGIPIRETLSYHSYIHSTMLCSSGNTRYEEKGKCCMNLVREQSISLDNPQ